MGKLNILILFYSTYICQRTKKKDQILHRGINVFINGIKSYNDDELSDNALIAIRIYLLLILIIGSNLVFAQDVNSATTSRVNSNKLKLATYPAMAYSPETSFEFGALVIGLIKSKNSSNDNIRPATFNQYISYSLRKQFIYSFKTDMYFRNKFYLNTVLTFFNYPDLFFGIGNNVSGKSEMYTDHIINFETNAARIIYGHTFIGIRIFWEYDKLTNFSKNRKLLNSSIEGYRGGKIFSVGPYFKYDTRNNTLYPSKGIYLQTEMLIFPEKILNDYSFIKFHLDVRYFTSLISQDNILACQLYYGYAGIKETVPFYMLPRLGGDSRLRGIKHENLYRDRNVYYFQLEGRRYLFWRLGGVVFAGLGGIDNYLSKFRFNNLKFIYGLGGRFSPFKNEKLNLRLDIGKGPENQYAIYIAAGEAF